MQKLKFTGERLVPELQIMTIGDLEHVSRYAFAGQFTDNKTVLDIACGEGYGTNLLAASAKRAIGVDISKEAIYNAKENYKADNLEFLAGSTDDIPLDSDSIDIVVSYETLEHHDRHKEMVTEIKRVLRTNGTLIISTPNKKNYQKREPDNPYHIKELDLNEFESLLTQQFKHVKIFSQRIVMGSLINDSSNEKSSFSFFSGNFKNIEKNLVDRSIYNTCYFNIAVCSDHDLSDFNSSCFFDGSELIINANKKYISVVNSPEYRLARAISFPIRFIKRIFL